MRKIDYLVLVSVFALMLGACSGDAAATDAPGATAIPTQAVEEEQPIQGFPTPDLNDPRFIYWNSIPVIEGAYDISDGPRAYSYFIVGNLSLVRNYYQVEMGGLLWHSSGNLGQGTDSLLMLYDRGEEKASISVIPTVEDEAVMRIILTYSPGLN